MLRGRALVLDLVEPANKDGAKPHQIGDDAIFIFGGEPPGDRVLITGAPSVFAGKRRLADPAQAVQCDDLGSSIERRGAGRQHIFPPCKARRRPNSFRIENDARAAPIGSRWRGIAAIGPHGIQHDFRKHRRVAEHRDQIPVGDARK